MPICRKCQSKIPLRVVIDGKERFLARRRFCLSCSPFGSHNTRANIDQPPRRLRSYSSYPREMRTEHSRRLLTRAHKAKNRLIELFGGKCLSCGYDKCKQALSFHHRDPKTKLFNLGSSSLRCKSWKEIWNEALKCVLLCSNCHIEEEHRIAVERMGVDLSSEAVTYVCTTVEDDPRGPSPKRGIPSREPQERLCVACGTPICNQAVRCRACAHVGHRKVERPSYETLLCEVAEMSMVAVGRKYGVTDNSVRKWLREYKRESGFQTTGSSPVGRSSYP